ncbi:MAG: S41 family peptidase [Chloroflexi bacterium]|nr:S41 family peptidase [Chloroflexota bacterium]
MLFKKIWPVFRLSLLLMMVFLVGFIWGNQNHVQNARNTQETRIPEEYLTPLYNAWDVVHQQYLNQPVNDELLMRGAIRGLMDSLNDPYSSYMDPEEFTAQSTPLEGEYTGIGAWVDTTGELLVIIRPMPDSPAEAVGIMPGDAVIGINGEDVTNMDPSLVLNQILGPAGTTVTLTIQRNGETLEFEVERAVITIPSVESMLMEENIGYIRLYNFGANSTEEVIAAHKSLWDQGASKLIFDLRNNTGGFVETAVEITSLFSRNDTILIEEKGDGSRKIYHNTGSTLDDVSPMVILINEGTASASEIVAGALQDTNRAKLIGATSYGKGFIQKWIPLNGDFGAVRITIARWLTPDGYQIQGQGLSPDISIILTEEDFQNQNDRQLAEAIDFLKNPDE